MLKFIGSLTVIATIVLINFSFIEWAIYRAYYAVEVLGHGSAGPEITCFGMIIAFPEFMVIHWISDELVRA